MDLDPEARRVSAAEPDPADARRARRWIGRIAIGLVVAAGGLALVRTRGGAATPGPSPGAGEDRVVPVRVTVAGRKDMPIWLEGLGTVTALQQVTVRAQVDGRLDKVLFHEGDIVKHDQVIAQIDPRPFLVLLHQAQGALARDKAQLETSQRNYDRNLDMLRQKLVSQQIVDQYAGEVGQFEGAIKIDRAQIENAELQLDYARVKTPLDGITGLRLVDAGNIIHASDPNGLVVVTAIDPAAVVFTVPQDQLDAINAALHRGDHAVPVEVFRREGGDPVGKGTQVILDNQINQTTATLRLKALVPNPDGALWPNAFVKVRMLLETRKGAIVIPNVAVQRGPQGTFVSVVDGKQTAQMKPVVVALVTDDQAIIAKGLDGGERVVVEGQNQLRPGSRVDTGEHGAGPGSNSGAGSSARKPGGP
jgi:multidrug efflux system membrane fusion protein